MSVLCVSASVPGYNFYKKLTAQEALISVGSNSLANFPVLVRITDPDLKSTANGGRVQNANGYDIVFTSDDKTTVINHQLEKYNAVTGELVAWVKIPALSATVNTDFYMYFGNSAVSVNPSTNLTWDLSFASVWHLNSNQNNATLNPINLTSNGTTVLSPGLAANGVNIATSQYLSYPASILLQINGDLTLESWMNFNSIQNGVNDNVIISSGDVGESGPDNYHYRLNLVGNGVNAGKLHLYWEHGSGIDVDVLSTAAITPTIGNWHHIAAMRDNVNSLVYFYFDGLQVGSAVSFASPPDLGSTATFQIGQDQNNANDDIDAGYDEVRISNSTRAPEWMQATFESNRVGSTFLTISTASCVPPDSAIAGPNQTVCISSPNAIMAANTPTAGVGTWAIVSGTGSIVSPGSPVTAITGLGPNQNVFSWSITSGTCSTVSQVTITVDALPTTAAAGANQTVCILNPVTTLSATPAVIGIGTWSLVSGSATLANLTAANSAVTVGVGTAVLRWTVVNGNVCAVSTDTMSIKADQATSIANAGPNQTVCINSPSTTLAANSPTLGNPSWSLIGTGTVTSPTNANSTVTNLGVGTQTLVWNIASVNSCPSTTSSMTIKVDPATIAANAGPNQTVCINSPSTTLAANSSPNGSWSISGTGTITSPTNPNSTVTNLGAGTQTLVWTIASVNSCPSTTSSMTIRVDPATSIANAGPNQTVCINSPSTTLAANSATTGNGIWSISGSGSVTSVTNPNSTVTNLAIGTSTLVWNIASVNSCASTTSSMTIKVDPATSIASAGPNQTVCINSPSTTLAANSATTGNGSWSINGTGAITTPTNPNSTVTNLGAGTQTLVWTIASINSCPTTSASMTIKVDQATSIANAGPNQTVCINSPSTTLAANSPTLGNPSWSIIGTGTVTSPTNANSTVTNLGVGTQTLVWNIASVNSCPSTTSSMTIKVDPATIAANAGPNQTVCINSPSTTLAANSSPNGSWSISGTGTITSPTNPNSTVTNLGAGTQTLVWNIASVNSCPSTTSSMTIKVDPAMSIANAGPNQTVCINSPSTTLAANSPTLGNPSWSIIGTGTVTSPTNPNSTVTNLAIGTQTLVWNIASVNSCPATTSSMTIKVEQATSIANAGPNQTVCINTPSATLAANSPTLGNGAWSLVTGTGTITTPTNPNTTVTNLGLGDNVFQWSITSVNSCSSSAATMTIHVDQPTSIAAAGPNQTVCINTASTTLAANSPTLGNPSWSISGSGSVTSVTNPNSTVTNLAIGTSTLVWTIASVNSCPSTTSSMTIKVDPAMSIANAGPSQTICINTPSTTLAANSPTLGNPSWSISGTGTVTSPTNANSTVTNLGVGTQTLTWNIASVNSCPSTTSSMTIRVDPAMSNANAGPNQTVCINSPSTTLAANSPTLGNPSWSIIGTGTVTSPTNPNSTVTNMAIGTQTLVWNIASVNSCPSTTSSMTVKVEQATSIANAGPNQTVCINTPTATLAANSPTTGNGAWTLVTGLGTITTPTNPGTTVTNLGIGDNVFQWNITSINTCSSSAATMTIHVDPATTIANAGPNQTICINSPTTALAGNSVTIGNGSWSISGSGSITSVTNPTTTVTNFAIGTSTLVWTIASVNSCPATTSSMTVKVEPATSIANAGPSQTVCINTPTATLAANSPTTGNGAWSLVTGLGTITTPTNPSTTVTNLGLGDNVFQWNITSINTCSSSAATMTIHVDPATTIANAGPNQTICINSPTTALAGNSVSIGNGSWSIIGTGTITSPGNPNTTVTNLAIGTQTLVWNIASVNSCPATTSSMTIKVDQATSIANAGPSQTVCINTPTATLAANSPTTGNGAWTLVTGLGTITTPTNPGTTVTNLGLGDNVFQWNITSINTCSSSAATMTIHVDPATTIANAGPNQTICINSPTTALAGNSVSIGNGSWTLVSGTGTITNPTNPNSTVTNLGLNDNVLQWNIASINSCPSTVSTMTIHVDQATSIANAGPSQTVCINTPTATLAANSPTTGNGAWTLVTGLGTITTPTNPGTTVTNLGLGDNVFQWNITSINTCSSSAATMTIHVDPATTIANAGPNQTICINSPTTALAGNSVTIGNGSWSIIGTGTITSPGNPNTTVTNLAIGTQTLIWNIASVNSCPATTSSMTIKVDQATSIANAGPSQTVCINTPTATLAANSPTTGNGAWTLVTGLGTITTPTNPSTTVTNLGLGDNVFQWNITSINTCSSSAATMTIHVDPATTIANAGPNQTICINSPTTAMAGNSVTIGNGSWSISGSGSITSVTNPTTTVTNFAIGTSTLVWTIASVNSCPATTSSMTVKVEPATSIANAGPSQTVCINTPTATLAANSPTTGNGAWSLVTGLGTITTPTNPGTTVTNLGLGDNVFQWNITSINTCSSSAATMTIHVDPATSIANAGPNQTICVNSPSTTLAANSPTLGNPSWSIAGTGTVTNPGNFNSTVTNLGIGTQTLVWNIASVNSCPSTTSSMTIRVDPAMSIANAGPSQTICINTPSTTLAANSPTLGTPSWSISGGGVVTSPTNPNSTVTGLAVGIHVLQWNIATINSCPSTSSSMTIQVDPATTAANAGPNQTVCINSPSATLAGNSASIGNGAWTLVTGTGTITTPTNPNTTVTNLGLGDNVFRWDITSVNTCSSTAASMTIHVDPATSIAAAGPNQTICINTASTTLAANSPTLGNPVWTIFGGGTVTNPTNPNSTVTSLGIGTHTLQWSIASVNSCASTTSSMTIKVDPATSIANAGPNQTLCISSPTTILAANAPTLGIPSWSISGTGTITSPSSPNSPVINLGLGPNVLQWNIASVNSCPSTSSSMTIQVDPNTSIANAGPNQTLCLSSPATVLAANSPTTGAGTWTVLSGSGVVTTATLANSGVTNLSLGPNVLRWDITSVNSCPSTASTMTIQVDAPPNVSAAGPNQTICINSPTAVLAANATSVGIGTWSVTSGTGVVAQLNSPTSTVSNLSLGNNVLQWKTFNTSACPATVSSMTIQVDQLSTIANAGPNMTLCTGNPTMMAANTPTSGVTTWSLMSGGANIINNTATSPVTALAVGINVFRWSIKNGVCPASTSTMSIQIDTGPTTSSAGVSQSVCISTNSATLGGNTPSAFSGVGTWSVVQGTGIVTNSTNPNSTVTNLSLGLNVFRWIISNTCGTSSSTVGIWVDQLPTAANAGTNQVECSLTLASSYSLAPTLTLTGNAPSVGTGTWSVVSGTGTIGASNSATTSLSNIGIGNNILQWAIGNGVCPVSISTMQVHIDNYNAGPPAGPNQTICAATPFTTLAATQPTSGVSTWTILVGSGTIFNPTLATSTASFAAAYNFLQWNAANGACPQFNAFVTINVDPAPTTASISTPNQTLCITSPTLNISGNVPANGTGTWSIAQGSGTIANTASASTTATLNVGTNVLNWSIGNGGACPNSVASVTIVVNGIPSIANAGPSQTICINTPSTTLAAVTPTGGTGSWSLVSGSGVITNSLQPNTTVTGLGQGPNVFQWTISSFCSGGNVATMTVQVDGAPSPAVAGPNQTVCITSPTAALAAASISVGAGTWSVMSGSGVVTNSNSPTATVTGLALGNNILRWRTTNGVCSSVSNLTILVNNPPTPAVVGPSQTICISSPTFALSGNTPSSGTGLWTMPIGSGTIVTPTLATSSVTNLAVGTNVLAWTISNPGCPSSVANTSITVSALPTTAVAGPNQTVCASSPSVVMAGNTPGLGTGSWSIGIGSGVIAGGSSPNATITGLATGTNTLIWKITNGACFSTSTMTVQVDPAPTVANAGPNQTLCITSPNTTLAANPAGVGSGSWTVVSGTASITTPTLANSTVTGIASGTNILQWTISNGVCVPSTSTMSINVFALPTPAVAGPNQTVCASSPSVVMAGNTPTLGTGSWSIGIGSGAIVGGSSPNATITGLATGTNTLIWKITNGACFSTSTMTVQVDPAPTVANAGSNQTLCITSPSTTLAANAPGVGTGSWTVVSGTAGITTPTLAGSTVTGIATGTNILQWSISNGVCAPSTSTMSIEVFGLPSNAAAGPNQTVCASSPSITLGATAPAIGTGSWTVLTGTATVVTPTLATSTLTNVTPGGLVLQWQVSNGSCISTATVAIQADGDPTPANAGPSQSLCITSPTTTLAGNVPGVGTGSWTVNSGTATIATPTLGTSTATFALGLNVLSWETSNGVCTSNSSTVSIEVFDVPGIANAGSNQTICISSPSAALAANTPTLGTGLWTLLLGTGSVADPTLATTSISGIVAPGTNVLEWKLINGACVNSSTMSIQVDDVPTVAAAGPNQTVCISAPTVTLAGNAPAMGTGSWSTVSGLMTANTPTLNTSVASSPSVGTSVLQWVISNGVCAPSISTVSIEVDTLVTPSNAGPSQTICASTPSINLSGNTPTVGVGTWSLMSGGGIFADSSLANTAVSNLSLNINVYEWYITNGGCSSASTVTVQVDNVPDISNAGPSQTICVSSPTTVLAANSPTMGVGSWSVISGSGTITNSLQPNSTVTALGTGTNILQWTVSNGVCAPNISTVSIQVDAGLVTANAGPNQTVCISSPSVTLAAGTPTLGTGTWSVLSGSGVVTDYTLATSTATNLSLNMNIFEWTVSNGGCSNSATMSVQVDNVPTAAAAGPSQSLCITSPSTTLAGNTPALGAGSWSVILGSGTITNSLLANSTVTALGTGTNILQWSIVNGVCPPSTSTVLIEVDNLATVANAGPNQTICISNASATLAANTPTLGSGSWQLLSGTGGVASSTSPSTTLSGIVSPGLDIMEWTITNGGCSNSATMSVQIDDVPDVSNAGTSQTICVSTGSTTLAAATPSGGVGVWTVVNGSGVITNSLLTNSTITGLGTGTNVLQWTIYSGVCAPSSSTMSIQVDNPATMANAGSDQTLCISAGTATLSGNTPTVGTGVWSVLSGSAAVTNSTLAGSTATSLTIGTNIFAWSITNGSCSSSDTMSIQVDALPDTAIAGSSQVICVSTGSVTLAANTPSSGVGTWSVISGSGIITNSLQASTSITALSAGTTIVQWNVTNGACAAQTSTLSIGVDDAPTMAMAGADQTICATSSTLMAITPSVGVGTWSVISGFATVTTPTLANSPITSISSGTTTLVWVVSNGSCAQSIDTVNIKTSSVGFANAGDDQTICPASYTMAAAAVTAGSGQWTLVSGSGTIADSLNPQTAITNLGFGANLFRWTVIDGYCPTVTDSVLIIRERPVDTAFVFGNDTTISANHFVVSGNTPTVGVGAWEVVSGFGTFANYLNNVTQVNDLAGGQNIIRWKITGYCGFTQDDIIITVTDMVLPNAISPNGDGKNDVFEVPDIGRYKQVELIVFNRWGSMVFEDKDYKNKWGGKNSHNNEDLTEDTYFYSLKMDGDVKTGFIIIKR